MTSTPMLPSNEKKKKKKGIKWTFFLRLDTDWGHGKYIMVKGQLKLGNKSTRLR